jgi:uncharacterized cupin superfamily protein
MATLSRMADDPSWFIANATTATWRGAPGWGRSVSFERDGVRFQDYGLNVHTIAPGERSTMYHGEGGQEDFLVVSGECLAIVEGEEHTLRQWDLLHCPAWTRHGFVNTGDAPCTLVMVGARRAGEETDCVYPVEPLAVRHGAGVQAETTSPDEAYAGTPDTQDVPYVVGTLPGA